MSKILVLLSGGLDSSTLLAKALERSRHEGGPRKVGALSIAYGQRHARELESAAEVSDHFGVPWSMFDLSSTTEKCESLFAGSSQTDDKVAVPHGKYDEPSMKATVVPNRNMVLLALAGAHAIAHDYDTLAYAAHGGDHAIYPDCRPEFVRAMATVLGLCDWKHLSLWVPFISWSKGAIVVEGLRLGVPFVKTWTCYEGGLVACGKCGSCTERLEAFQFAGQRDPIPYAV